MYLIIWTLLIAITIASGLAFGRIGSQTIRYLIRASDKSKMKAAIKREAYLNQLYEESLFEEMDKIAIKAAKKMDQVNRTL